MSRIVINAFGGIAPKISRAKLPPPLAQTASNAKTWSGSLRAFHDSFFEEGITKTGDIQSLYYYAPAETWLSWTQDVTVAKNQQSGDTLDKIYYTGTDYPRVTTNTLHDDGTPGTSIPPASYILGIPTPTDVPSGVDAAVAGNPDGTYRLVYTYVRVWSDGTVDESAPSPVSASVTVVTNKITWTLPNAALPTVGNYNITHKRLYRLNTGATSADYLYLAQITVATTTYLDDIADTSLGDANETTDDLPAPDELDGLLALENGIYVGFAGRTVYCSAPYRAHAYPEANQYTVPDTIVGLGAFGTTVVVLTDGKVRVGQVLDPAAVNFEPVNVSRACSTKRSIVSTQFGVFFATVDGIAKVSPGGYDLVTRKLFGREEWASYYPDTIHAHWLEDRYVGFYHSDVNPDGTYVGGGFVFDPNEGVFTPVGFVAYGGHVRVDLDRLYLTTKDSVLSNQIEKWEGATNLFLANEWKSALNLVEPATVFAYGLVEADYGTGLTQAEADAINDENDAARAANLARFATDLGGAVNEDMVNGVDVNGDDGMMEIQSEDVEAERVTFRLYANDDLFDEVTVTDSYPFALVMPSGTLGPATRFELWVSANIPVHKMAVANDADELAGV